MWIQEVSTEDSLIFYSVYYFKRTRIFTSSNLNFSRECSVDRDRLATDCSDGRQNTGLERRWFAVIEELELFSVKYRNRCSSVYQATCGLTIYPYVDCEFSRWTQSGRISGYFRHTGRRRLSVVRSGPSNTGVGRR